MMFTHFLVATLFESFSVSLTHCTDFFFFIECADDDITSTSSTPSSLTVTWPPPTFLNVFDDVSRPKLLELGYLTFLAGPNR